MTLFSHLGHLDTAAREIAPAAVLFDLYDTLVHARAGSYFYHSVPTALGVEPRGSAKSFLMVTGRSWDAGDGPGAARAWPLR